MSSGGHRLPINITNQAFGRLTALLKVGNNNCGSVLWKCKCVCGNETTVTCGKLRAGQVRSCGCLRKDAAYEATFQHGLTNTSEYKAWWSLRDRCNNTNNPRYERYGGRGIKVCSRWEQSFLNFLSDMGYKPSPELSIERIDNNGNYEPNNCKWATDSEQASNRERRRWPKRPETTT